MKALQTIAAGVLVLGMGSAFAAEPVALNDSQMDNVSAGALVAGSVAAASADYGITATQTTANGVVIKHSVQAVSTTGTAIAVGDDPRAFSASFVAVTH